MSITALGSFYGNISRINAATTQYKAASTGSADAASDAAPASSTSVSISAEARQAASADARMALPDSIRQAAQADLARVFPPDIIAEAQARRQANAGIGGSSATPGMGNLPLLPENQALLAKIRSDMQEARAASPDGMFNLTPYARLMQAVQTEGWKSPMTMEDAQREVDISQAMSRLPADPSTPPLTENEQAAKDAASMADIEQQLAGQIPDKWRQRWQEEGLVMPDKVSVNFPDSMWPKLAEAAGIPDQTFMDKARELAQTRSGNDYLQAIETFISSHYSSLAGKQTAST